MIKNNSLFKKWIKQNMKEDLKKTHVLIISWIAVGIDIRISTIQV